LTHVTLPAPADRIGAVAVLYVSSVRTQEAEETEQADISVLQGRLLRTQIKIMGWPLRAQNTR
jgi:hypothetical protein